MPKSRQQNRSRKSAGTFHRALTVGAEPQPDKRGTHFCVWAPDHSSAQVVFEDLRKPVPLASQKDGYFSGYAPDVQPGTRYKYQIADQDSWPDPASRYQPTGPHGFSEVVDSTAYPWSDSAWSGVELAGQVIYELHIGTFTNEGFWRAATEKLPYLHETGVTLIEVMPVSDFPGKFGWGYDGVQPYAPASIYGTPDEMRQFVDRAHGLGIGVILDVVYNHVGPDGNYLPKYSSHYFTHRHTTDWGEAINFDGDSSGPVRSFFCENATYWIREFHLDGLRLDATQDIHDDSKTHIITEIVARARAVAAPRSIVIIGENEPQNSLLIKSPKEGGFGLDALWNDDFHHTSMVALTGKADAYYSDYRGSPQEFVSAAKYGYLYQGQWYRWQKKRRGTLNLKPPRKALVTFIQNHDQVANSAHGLRVSALSAPGVLRALTALTILGPGTPMLFQGQEFASSSPFFYFADHKEELAKMIRLGRLEFLEQWRSLRTPQMKGCLVDPCSEDTFKRSKLDFSEVEKHQETYLLHRDLLQLRKKDPTLRQQGENGIDGAVLSPSAFVLRYFSPDFQNDRLLVFNLGVNLEFDPAPEPLLAPVSGMRWSELWSSEDARYGCEGTAPLDSNENWRIPGQAAVVLHLVSLGG
jgi:maltooligosyltrehalose trehalohydrolase